MIEWKINGVFKADVNKVDAEIKSIGNEVTASDLVEYARENKESELYKCFEWDNEIAAEQYRLEQARKVLRFIVEVPETKGAPQIREYSHTSDPKIYSPTRTFMVNKDEYESLLERAYNELRAFKEKYKNLTELEDVFAAIDAL